MWPISMTSALLVFGLVACNPSKGAVEPDTGDGEAKQAGKGEGGDVTPSACEAGHRCANYGESCQHGRTRCHCTSPCSGMELMPEESYPRWACREIDPKCPDAVPEPGERCRSEGLICGWGTCGGSSAVCEDHRWSVHSHGPPP